MEKQTLSTIPCPSCGHPNAAGARFCNACGRPLSTTCPHCGATNPPGSRYCSGCGRPLDAQRPPDQPERPELPQGSAGPETSRPGDAPLAAQPRQAACPRCNALNDTDAVYCYHCGLPLQGEAGFGGSRSTLGIPAYSSARPAGFWLRLAAYLIDGLIVGAVFVLTAPRLLNIDLQQWLEQTTTGADAYATVLQVAYFTLTVAIFATTVGKRALGMQVLRTDGGRPGLVRALVRALGQLLSGLFFGLGFLLIALRADKRGLHDLIAGTVVVRRR